MGSISKNFRLTTAQRRLRVFSESFRKERVNEVLEKRATVSQICRAHELSYTAVYKWIALYSNHQSQTRTIVEAKSDTTKILALEKKIAELERLLGQKEVQLQFNEKMIEIAEQTYQVDIKKKFGTKP